MQVSQASNQSCGSRFIVRDEEPRGVHGKGLLVPVSGLPVSVSGDSHRGLSQYLALAACRVVFRKIVRVDKCEQRKGGENYNQYPDKFPFHDLLPDRTS